MRKAEIWVKNQKAGLLKEDEDGFHFIYDAAYIILKEAQAVSLTLPLQEKQFTSKVLFPFFDGLIPEGWLLEVAEKNWKLNPRDRMGLLLTCCKDCIGSVSVHIIKEEE
ncbi:MAG: HipA N-terminal domain-containing protein [Saprospiraceae bacterium]|nr:HipA N-terminal domain-containing protein [Saprospiraceae bacterium]